MEPVILKLKYPFSVGSEEITELKVRAPKAKDIRKLPANPDTGDILNLAGKLCGLPPSVIDELSMPDTSELLGVVGNFMQPGQETGKKD
jgi:hypothetical protein